MPSLCVIILVTAETEEEEFEELESSIARLSPFVLGACGGHGSHCR